MGEVVVRSSRACAACALVMAWLLDTNVLAELRRPRPDRNVVAFVAGQPMRSLFVSVASLAEVRFGIELIVEPTYRAELNHWLQHDLRPMFAGRVLPITEEIMLRWRILVEEGRKAGHTYPQPDLLIAATGIEHGLTVVTRDRRDYERTRVPILNPWVAP